MSTINTFYGLGGGDKMKLDSIRELHLEQIKRQL